jgi:hypothetical protein
MASFRKRGELQWQARISRKEFPPQVKTFNTRAEAEAWARQVETEIDRGAFVSRAEAEATTLREAFSRYDREIVSAKKGAAQESSIIRIWQDTNLANRSMASALSFSQKHSIRVRTSSGFRRGVRLQTAACAR